MYLKEIDPYSLPKLKLQVYWAMEKMATKEKDRFSISEISNFLVEKIGIHTTNQAISKALGRDSGAVNKRDSLIKLMEKGRQQIFKNSQNNVIYIEAGKPFTAKSIDVKKIFSRMKTEVKICDPYCGVGLLSVIHSNLSKNLKIKILTQHIIDKPTGSFSLSLKDLRAEGFNIEIKQYNNSKLHDRYIIDKKDAWLSGNSLNDLGNKESFIINLGIDVRQSLESMFNQRWKAILQII
jgi:hypothetical protein